MDIVIMIDGEELSRWPVQEQELLFKTETTWQERAIANIQTVDLYLQWVKMKTQKQIQKFNNVTYVLAIESKINRMPTDSITLSLTDHQFELLYHKGLVDGNGDWIENNKLNTHER